MKLKVVFVVVVYDVVVWFSVCSINRLCSIFSF